VITTIVVNTSRVIFDRYIFDTLMGDLIGHDKQPSAFIVYVYLWSRNAPGPLRPTAASLQQIAVETGLSKSAVQQALRTLRRRKLVQSKQKTVTSVPEYVVLRPWVRG
jgi:DNA-binding MarR family transcriptional regulator